MADDLLTYYERELHFLRQMGADFAAKYPKIAGRLLLEADECEDPHVERLIQAFAFLTGRIHRKLDDEFPELTDGLLTTLYPHYLAPIPSMAVVQFVVDPDQGQLSGGHLVPKGAALYSQPVNGAPCRFRTCYPVTLWPLKVVSAKYGTPDQSGVAAAAVIKLELRCLGRVTLNTLALDSLRFFLHGESHLTYALYELLMNHLCQVQIRPLKGQAGPQPIVLSSRCLRPVGFGRDEGLLPYSFRSFLGYRLLEEYFCFPEKFLFVELGELRQVAEAGLKDGMELLFVLDRAPRADQPIGAETFRLGCAPIVNLFDKVAEPIRLTHAQAEYQVVPDVRRPNAAEVYSVDDVVSSGPDQEEPMRFQPFYSVTHASEPGWEPAYWHAIRRPSPKKDDAGTEVYLSLVDPNFRPTVPAVDTLTVRVTCTNRDLPGKLPFGGDGGSLTLEEAAPLSKIRCLTKPTDTVRPPLRQAARWRLISHLSLNYLSICEGGREALQEILRDYNFADSPVVRQQIDGILRVKSRQVVARPPSLPWNGFCRGAEVTIEFDEEKYVGSGVFLFASVLEAFLGLYASMNSFSQLIAVSRQREEPIKRWPPRAGEQILL